VSHTNWINKGVVGDDAGHVVARFQGDVRNCHPTIVTIAGGTNDGLHEPGTLRRPEGLGHVPEHHLDGPAGRG
jgi:lysophospholipase L1-like esterase